MPPLGTRIITSLLPHSITQVAKPAIFKEGQTDATSWWEGRQIICGPGEFVAASLS